MNKENIIAFKVKETGQWYTGEVTNVLEPNTQYNKTNDLVYSVSVNIPIEPQWYEDGDITHYTNGEIEKYIILE